MATYSLAAFGACAALRVSDLLRRPKLRPETQSSAFPLIR
jgi:hypothetical protein